ncbi:UNKNOWN [Stylonychia lemnae]|uniref:Uncharacterized protein n=1 Tax=Stylonychia lemnae TaxID=5949 RepID=A0A078AAJ9_STYLE|nr:UNKNOWN [Stylonychia lemnae]|eukprot:CDW78871.1 UNKNOWN [Stylonychia lemnae]
MESQHIDILSLPTVQVVGIEGEWANIITSPCHECCFLDQSVSAQNPKNQKTLEQDYKGNLKDRPEETKRTIDVLNDRRANGTLTKGNFLLYLQQYQHHFRGKPLKGIILCGLKLGNEGGHALLEFIRILGSGCLKSINIRDCEVPEDIEQMIWQALEGHPINPGDQNCRFTRSNGSHF